MKKGSDYKRLERAGLPVPMYGVFDETCLTNTEEGYRLSTIVHSILTDGSGNVGIRTEPKSDVSPLGSYPHIMPLITEQAVRSAIQTVIEEQPAVSGWWFLVNEAFTGYEWNAVVKATEETGNLRRFGLTGEVNDHDNAPLRQALANTDHCLPFEEWTHPDKARLQAALKRSGILEEWLEVSCTLDRGEKRMIFWGFR